MTPMILSGLDWRFSLVASYLHTTRGLEIQRYSTRLKVFFATSGALFVPVGTTSDPVFVGEQKELNRLAPRGLKLDR